MANRNVNIIRELIKFIVKVKEYCDNIDYDSFAANTQLHEACVFNLFQMGESANRLDEKFTTNYSEIPWFKIRGLRNRIAHDYEGISIDIIWDIIQNDLDPLQAQLLLIETGISNERYSIER